MKDIIGNYKKKDNNDNTCNEFEKEPIENVYYGKNVFVD